MDVTKLGEFVEYLNTREESKFLTIVIVVIHLLKFLFFLGVSRINTMYEVHDINDGQCTTCSIILN
jgi:hypothetical protein